MLSIVVFSEALGISQTPESGSQINSFFSLQDFPFVEIVLVADMHLVPAR